jgi:hypothetical protein
MLETKKNKIIIFDNRSAHGSYIGRAFKKEIVYFSSKYKNLETVIQNREAAFIFVITDFKSVKILKSYLGKDFEKILICSDNYNKESIPLDIPFNFVSLNVLKDDWMKQVIEWLVTERSIEVSDFIKVKDNPYAKYLKNFSTQTEFNLTA